MAPRTLTDNTRYCGASSSPQAGPGIEMARHDFITGMPVAVCSIIPAIGASGSVIMIEEGMVEDIDDDGG